MAKVTIAFGLLLILEGVGFYLATGAGSITALIPAMVGAPLFALGLVALKDSLRKHAMHGAAAVGLLGFLAATGRLVSAGVSASTASAAVLLMGLLCGLFLVLCVKSFIDARRRQAAARQGP